MDIEQLLKKFYDGTSTPEEERFLKEYFQNEQTVDERWNTERLLFQRLCDEEIEVPPGVSGRLEKAIERMTAPQHVQLRKKAILYWISSAAAVILICTGLFFTVRDSAQPTLADTFDDPTEAAIVAGQALAFMSSQLNRGLEQVADAGQEVEKVNQLLNKHLNP
jgi:hypothetical protein